MTKIGLRRVWFQAHKWIGLILAALIIPLCLSGAALVWHDALDKALNPQRHALTSTTARLAPQAYAAAAQRVLGDGERIAAIRLQPGEPVLVTAARAPQGKAAGRPVRTLVWLDPGTARVLDKGSSSDGLVRFLHQLHGSLMIPGMGRAIVGWIGVAMLVSSISGLWLWWPTVGNWRRGLRWSRHRKLDSNLHHQFGFWIALPLFVLSLTGAWISFPVFFGALSGEPAPAQRGDARFRARPLEAPVQSAAAAVAAAGAVQPGAVTALTWPTDQKAEWAVTIKPEAGLPATVTVADRTGAAAISRDGPQSGNGLARTMRKIHDGTDMGLAWQIVIFLGGAVPVLLAVTGIIMWWRARHWRAKLRTRETARA